MLIASSRVRAQLATGLLEPNSVRIVVRCEDPREARAAQKLLSAAGIEASALAGAFRPAPDGEDLAVFPGEPDAAARLASLTRGSERAPLACIVGLAAATPPPAGLSVGPAFDGAIALDATPAQLTAQVEACVRLAGLQDEEKRRRATVLSLGHAAPKLPDTTPLRVLYIGAPNAMFLALEQSLAAASGAVVAAFSSFSGFDHLHDEAFDAVVLNAVENTHAAVALCAALRRNAQLYHLPTMVVTAAGDVDTAHAAIERGAVAVADVASPCGPPLGWLFEAVRRDRKRRVSEHQLRALRDLVAEPRTGLFRIDAFNAHVERLAREHHASGRPFALAALRAGVAPGARPPEGQAWRKACTEVADLAARLLRETDCGANVFPDVIAVALPATDLLGARRTGERIASVAECTTFAPGEAGDAPIVFEQSAVELQPGESGAGLVARALRGLGYEQATA